MFLILKKEVEKLERVRESMAREMVNLSDKLENSNHNHTYYYYLINKETGNSKQCFVDYVGREDRRKRGASNGLARRQGNVQDTSTKIA